MDDLQQCRVTCEELRGRSPSAPLFRNSDSIELKHMLKRLGNAEGTLGPREDVSTLKETNQSLAIANSELVKQLEQADSRGEQLRLLLEEAEDEVANKSDVIVQAQGIITRLNKELESMTTDLHKAKKQVELYRREGRGKETTVLNGSEGPQRHNSVFWGLSAIEQEGSAQADEQHRAETASLRAEIASLRAEIQRLKEEKDAKVREITETAEQATADKRMLEDGFEMLEVKVEDIERHSQAREATLIQQRTEIEALRQELAQSQKENHETRVELEANETKHNEELATLKRHAENVMKQLYPKEKALTLVKPAKAPLLKSFSSVRLCTAYKKPSHRRDESEGAKSTNETIADKENVALSDQCCSTVISQLQAEDTFQQLQESQFREEELRLALRQLTELEANFIGTKLKGLSALDVAVKPEIERWIMRNEELEQNLAGLTEHNAKLLKLVCDLQKAISIKGKQMLDHKHLTDVLRKEHCIALDFLRLEAKDTRKLIVSEILPKNDRLIHQHADDISKVKNLYSREAALSRTQLELVERQMEETGARCQELDGELIVVKAALTKAEDTLTRADVDFTQIRLVLNLEDVSSSRLASLREDAFENSGAVSPPAEEVINAIKTLKHQLNSMRSECYDKLAEIERERPFVDPRTRKSFGLKELDEFKAKFTTKEAEWDEERQQLIDQIRNVKEIAKLDSETRSSLLNSLEEEILQLRDSLVKANTKLSHKPASYVGLQDYSTMDASIDKPIRSKPVHRRISTAELEEADGLESRDLNRERLVLENRELLAEIEVLKMQLSLRDPPTSSTSPLKGQVHSRYQSNSSNKMFFSEPKRSFNFHTGDQMAQHYKQLMETKDSQIAKLEGQVDSLLRSQDPSLKGSALNSMQGSFIGNVLDVKDTEALQTRYYKLVGEAEHLKSRHERRVKEFELILRYLEEKITAVAMQRPINAEVAQNTVELAKRNPNLKVWIEGLADKLDMVGSRQAAREKHTLREIISLTMDYSDVHAQLEQLSALQKDLNDEFADMNIVSNRVVAWLYKAFKTQRRPRD